MITSLLVLHLLVTLVMIGVVLIQRSEGGGLGIGASQGMGAFMSGRGTANLLTRATAVLAAAFMALSLVLALLNRGTGGVGRDILALPRTATHAGANHPTPLAAPVARTTPAPEAGAAVRPAPSAPAAPGAPAAPAEPTPSAPTGPAVPTR